MNSKERQANKAALLADVKIIRKLETVIGQKIKAKRIIGFGKTPGYWHSYVRNKPRITHLCLINCNIKSLTHIIPLLKKLNELEHLDLTGNQIGDIPILKELKNLQELNLSGNQISNISELNDFDKLKELKLSRNKINKIPSLKGLKRLYSLDLSENQISDTTFIKDLPQLHILYLNSNNIKNIQPLQKHTSFAELDLSKNKIEYVDANWIKKIRYYRNAESFLDLTGNPITNIPPSILKLDIESLRKYFEERAKGTILAYESKLILVGNGRVGKTSLIKRWLDNAFDPNQPSTHAIQLRTHELNNMAKHLKLDHLILNIWDFGGQDIYQATHKLFMRSNAIFLLVWDVQTKNMPEQEEILPNGKILYYKNYSLKYWLSYIKTLSSNSPIILIQTNRDKDGKRKGVLTEEQITEYNVWDIISIESSTATFDGFKGLEESIEEVVLKQVRQHSMEMPKQWYRLRNQLIELQRQQIKQLALKQFYIMCQQEGIDKSSANALLNYLHNSGVILYSQGLINDKIIIDQAWAINAIYTLLDRKGKFSTLNDNGQFTGKDLQIAWQQYNGEKQQLFLHFMEECEICFEIDKEKNSTLPFAKRVFIAPQLLPKEKPEDLKLIFRNDKGIYYRYRHKFLHAAVIQRFIVRVGFMADHKKMWQTGIILSIPEGIALVEAFADKNEIVIRIEDINQKDLLNKIRNEMNEINKDETGIEEFVSLDGNTFINLNNFTNRPLLSDTIQAENGLWVNAAEYQIFLDHYDKKLFEKENKKNRSAIPQKRKKIAELQQEISSKCPLCRSTDVGHFEVHHIDENPDNNITSNLLLVCPTCHSKITKGDIKSETVFKIKSKYISKAINPKLNK
jgi:GTPase SAR1 family protein